MNGIRGFPGIVLMADMNTTNAAIRSLDQLHQANTVRGNTAGVSGIRNMPICGSKSTP